MQKLLKPVADLLLYLFRLINTQVAKLRFVIQGREDPLHPGHYPDSVKPQDQIADFMAVFKPTRIFFVFNILAFVIFLMLPQGKDVILIVIEDLSRFHIWSLLSLLVGVAFWAVVAEFGARYKIYIADNSGRSLTGERVNYRKQLQSFFSMVYLLLPYLAVLLSVIIVTFKNIAWADWTFAVGWPFVALVVLLILSAAGLARFYLDDDFNKRFRASKSVKGLYLFLKLPEDEMKWLGRLYGIYNDYVYTIRKETVFKQDTHGVRKAYDQFIQSFKRLPPDPEFPDGYVIESEQVPVPFRPPDHFDEEYMPDFNHSPYRYQTNPAGSYRWVYANNPRFYKVLHAQVKTIAFGSLILLLLISLNLFLPYDVIGSPGLLCLAFGCWTGVYTGLLYIDYRFRKRIFVSARWLLIVWFLVVSLIDQDHPVRYNEEGKQTDTRLSLGRHFSAWLAQHEQNPAINDHWSLTKDPTMLAQGPLDSARLGHTPLAADSVEYPVVFITAEGGALRTGAFTAMLLAAMEDTLHHFKNDIYAFSTVSGGSVGISFFNAVNYLDQKADTLASWKVAYYQKITRDFFSADQLSPVLAKMFYGDVLNYLWPWHIERFDRAIALEKAWEEDYSRIFNKTYDNNIYSEDFLSIGSRDSVVHPAWFINTTEVESGLQCFLTNARPDSFLFEDQRDLLREKIRGGINYSTAVGFSSRFPLFSPSVAIKQNDNRTYHYVDGGYVENTGAKTMLEVLQVLRSRLRHGHVKPYVIQLLFGSGDEFQSTGFLNELSSIGHGIYNIREGYSDTYSAQLRDYVDSTLHGVYIKVPLEASTSAVPMSWVFSERSLDSLGSAVSHIMHNTHNDLNQKLITPFKESRP